MPLLDGFRMSVVQFRYKADDMNWALKAIVDLQEVDFLRAPACGIARTPEAAECTAGFL